VPSAPPTDVAREASSEDEAAQETSGGDDGTNDEVTTDVIADSENADADATADAVDDVPTESGCSSECVSSTSLGSCSGDEGSAPTLCPTTCDQGTCHEAIAVAAGEYHTCALLSNATAYCWGDNSLGSFGNGAMMTGSHIPVPVGTPADIKLVAAGGSHTCALRSDGTVWCWGNYGEADWTGDAGILDTPMPLKIEGATGATDIVLGTSTACAILADRTVACWGHNDTGQLGDGTMSDSASAARVSGLSTVRSVAVATAFACASLEDGSVECWGSNQLGGLGNGTETDSPTPVKVSGLASAVTLAGGWDHVCARLADDTVQCWGSNQEGQLGVDPTTSTMCGGFVPCSTVPLAVAGVTGASGISAGQGYTCVLQSGGTVSCLGANFSGQLGTGSAIGPSSCGGDACSTALVPVSGLVAAAGLSCGGAHCCALGGDGSVQCWGDNASGEIGDPASFGPSDCGGAPCSPTPLRVQW
jgi:alpha-tubulin suppressor-like RCC1 family protein